ncbi:MAG: ABC transporter permease [Chitinophagaceae bacterium]
MIKQQEIITSKPSKGLADLKELHRYKHLLVMLIKRDFVAFYKQTILGPLWLLLQPLLTTIMFVIVFGRIAGLSTDGTPQVIFYLSGITLWSYFAECFNKTATVFKDNAQIFGKVYFPRLVIPISIVVSGLFRFLIQFTLFSIFYCYYLVKGEVAINISFFFLPLILILMALLSLGLGMIISAMTTKYRDLSFLITFGVQLLMYITPVIYPLSSLKANYAFLMNLNPLTSFFELFRYSITGKGTFTFLSVSYSALFTGITLIVGLYIFNRVQRTFMDTV